MSSQHRALEVMIRKSYLDPEQITLTLSSPYHHTKLRIESGAPEDFENLDREQQQLLQSFRDVISTNSVPDSNISRNGLLETSKYEFPGLGAIHVDSYEPQLADMDTLKAERIRQQIWDTNEGDYWDDCYFRPKFLQNARVYASGTEDDLECLHLKTVCDAVLTHKFNNDLSPRDAEIVEVRICELSTEERAQRRGSITEDELEQRFEELGGKYNRGWGGYELEIRDPVSGTTLTGSTDLGIKPEEMNPAQHALLAKFNRILESKSLHGYQDLEQHRRKMDIREYENEYVIHGLGHLKISTMEIPQNRDAPMQENPHWKDAKFSEGRIGRNSRFLFLENIWNEKINPVVATQDAEWERIKSQRPAAQAKPALKQFTRC